MKIFSLSEQLPPKKDDKWNESKYVFFFDSNIGLTSVFIGWYDFGVNEIRAAHHKMPSAASANRWFEIPKSFRKL